MPNTLLMGTVLRQSGTWYIRLVGGGGTMVPLTAPANVTAELVEGSRVQIDGEATSTSCTARSVKILSNPTDGSSVEKGSSHLGDWRVQIARELEKAEPDWKVIEAASRQAVDSDPDAVRFSVDAAHIQRLGEQLVSKQETALSELIKNAFDADATVVTLDFERQSRVGGRLRIADDGNGMTEAVIRSSWMRISTNNKEEQPLSPMFDRVRAGRKGIGRFSVQRLGRRLNFITKPVGETIGFKVEFLWDESFTSGRSLFDVFSRIERFEKAPSDKGTVLEIEDLRDAWSASAIERVWRAVVKLQAPFPIAKPPVNKKGDPGFQVIINQVTQEKQSELFSIEKSFLSNALAEITAEIDEDGFARVRLVSAKLDIDEFETSSHRFLLTGPVTLESRYFIFDTSLLSGMTQAQAAGMGRDFGGIRIYRNGFRVQPYGEPSDDWLGLAFDTGRRNLLIPANNNNFFGHVSVTTDDNPLFEETSSREGLIENDAFDELRGFARWALEWAALRIAGARQRKKRAGERGFTSLRIKPSAVVQEIIERRHVEESPDREPTKAEDVELIRLKEVVTAYEEQVEAKIAASIEYEEMLRILASLGLSISVFGHEIKGSERAMVANLMLLEDLIGNVPSGETHTALQEQHDDLHRSAGRLFDIGSYIGGLMSRTESRELRDLSVKGAIDRFARQFGSYMAKQNISFEVDVEPPELRTTPMHAAEFDSVLLNFLTNSIKSMKRAKVTYRQVRIEARREGRYVAIAFEDNGVGIAQEIQDRVFDPFFTTTMAAEDDGVAGPGTGLGLKIVADIAENYGGEVSVAPASNGYTCRMEFSVLALGDGDRSHVG